MIDSYFPVFRLLFSGCNGSLVVLISIYLYLDSAVHNVSFDRLVYVTWIVTSIFQIFSSFSVSLISDFIAREQMEAQLEKLADEMWVFSIYYSCRCRCIDVYVLRRYIPFQTK